MKKKNKEMEIENGKKETKQKKKLYTLKQYAGMGQEK